MEGEGEMQFIDHFLCLCETSVHNAKMYRALEDAKVMTNGESEVLNVRRS